MATSGIEFNVSNWDDKLAVLVAVTGQTMAEAVTEEWPLLIRKVMDFTPPFQAGGSSSDLSIGRAAVSRDIRKTMRPFAPKAHTKGLAKIIADRNIEAFNIVASRVKSGPMKGQRAARFSPSIHTSQRNARGRVGGQDRGEEGFRGVRVLGSDAALLAKYIATVQSRVGWAKSGWLLALWLVGGKAPAYVENQLQAGQSAVEDYRNDPEGPAIIAYNRTPWAVRKDEASRIVGDAFKSRANAIASKVKTKIRLAAQQKAGFDMVA